MAWNFRRRKKIAPGVYINMSKKGVSTTVGRRGATMTFGPNGTYLNTSIPGTGMYNRRKLSSSSSNIQTTNVNLANPMKVQGGCALILVLLGVFNFFFLVDWLGEFEWCYEIWEIPDFAVFFIGNIAFGIFGLLFEMTRHSIQQHQSVFSYKREKRNAKKVLDSLSFNDKEMRNILKAYIQCLTINEEFDKEQDIIEELKKSTNQKALDLVPIHEARLEALKVSLERARYNADENLSEEQKQAFKLFTDSFEILCDSDKIWFEIGITPRGLIQRAETKFEFGVFDYIKSEFEIPVIRIPQTSINFYIYPHFIIRSESTTNFRIYPIEKIEIEYTSLNFREEYKQHLMQPKDATLISSNFLYETKKGEPDRRHAYNPLYITYDYGKLTIPQFRFTRSMTFYVSNRDSAKNMQEAYVNYLQYCKNDTPKEENKLASNIVQIPFNRQTNITAICDEIYIFRNLLSNNKDFIHILKNKHIEAITGIEDNNWQEIIDIIILCDLCHCYTNLVDPLKSLKEKEYSGYIYLVHLLQTGSKINIEQQQSDRFYKLHEEERLLFGTFISELTKHIEGTLILSTLLAEYHANTQLQYNRLIYRLLSATAKIDGENSKQEEHFLSNIMFNIKSIDYKADESDDKTLPDKWYELANEKYRGNYNLIHIALKIVALQKCVVIDIQAELMRDRTYVVPLLEILESKGVILKEGKKRTVCVANEDELYEKLNGENSENNIMENTNDEIDISRIERPDPILQDVITFIRFQQEPFISTADIQRKFEIGYNRAGKISDQLEELGVLGPNKGQEGREVLIDTNGKLKENNTRKENVKKTKTTSKSSTSELDALVGLSSVKEEIKTLSNFIKIQQKRKEQGLKSSSVSYPCVFTGNPGTGKTTVARIVAQIYKDLGILSKGHLVETDRAGLVAEYVGQTAVKTNKIIDSALDGVLFIDEAYSLIGTGQDYGKEAIATLLKRMEDDRDRLVVILAGYSKEMQDFINTNPGLQSRFNRYIEFPDYSAEELLQIFEKNIAKFDYKLEKEARVAMAEYFQNAVENKDANFGNARFVRNIFEKTLEKQANRLSTDPDLDTEELTLITKEDLPTE